MSDRWALTKVVVTNWDPRNYRWDHENATIYQDATFRSEANSNHPQRYGLRVAREVDPETGTKLDADGDRSVVYYSIDAYSAWIGSDGAIRLEGYIEERDPDGRLTGAFRKQAWDQFYHETELWDG